MAGIETEAVAARDAEDRHRSLLAAALAGAGTVALVGGGALAAQLVSWRPDLFVSEDAVPPAGAGVLALEAADPILQRAVEVARGTGAGLVHVLAPRVPPTGALRAAGLVLEGWVRLVWEPAAPGGVSRAERLESETREVLLRCVRSDDPGAVVRLEEAVARLQRELDVRAQLEVDHARTREAERARAERLRELETALQRLGGVDLAAEVERLRAEILSMQATRLWRAGARWWRLKERLRPAGR